MEPRFQAFERWMRDVRRLRGATLVAYGDTLKNLDTWLTQTGQTVDTVTSESLERFMSRPRRGGITPAPATQDRDRSAMQSFWKWAHGRGLVATNPTLDVGVPKVRNRKPKAVPDDVWVRLWASEIAPDDRVWLGMMCFAGLRRREIVSLRPEQVDCKRGLLLGLQRKGGTEDAVEFEQMAMLLGEGLPRLLPEPELWLRQVDELRTARIGERCLIPYDMPTTAKERLSSSWDDDDDDLPSAAILNKQLTRLQRNADLPHAAYFSPHALRHTAVTNLLRCGVPIEVVSDAVGHTNIDTTRRYVKSAGRLAEWRKR